MRPGTVRRILAVGLVAGLALALEAWGVLPRVTDGASALPSCGIAGRVVSEGEWTVISPPWGDRTGLFAVNPVVFERIFATDGRTVMRSVDGGCTWQQVYDAARDESGDARTPSSPPVSLPRLPVGSSPAPRDGVPSGRIVAVAASASSPSDERVYLLVYDEPKGLPPAPRVVASTDGGATWRTSREGLPGATEAPETGQCGELSSCKLVPAPGDPAVAYYVHTPPAGAGEVYATRDGGATWERRGSPPAGHVEPLGPGGPAERLRKDLLDLDLSDLAVDPLDSEQLWALGARGSFSRSLDGGRSWEIVPLPTPVSDPGLLDVSHVPGSKTRIMFFDAAGEQEHRRIESVDGGATFRMVPARGLTGALASIASGGSPASVMVATSTGIFRYEAERRRFSDVDALRLSPVDQAQASRGAEAVFYFRSPKGLAAFRTAPADAARARSPSLPGPPGLPGVSGGLARPGSGGVEHPGAGLSPARIELRLTPQESRTLRYELSSSGRGSPLDVFFLIDTSGSMSGAIGSLAGGLAEVVDELEAAGVNAHFGLGEFSETVRYRRIRDIGPPDEEFTEALAGLQTDELVSSAGEGLNGVGGEPNLTALHQMATGAGLPNPRRGPPVAPRQGASFREGSVRVVVHLADENFYYDPDGPSRDETVAALLARSVAHLGVQVLHEGAESSVLPPALRRLGWAPALASNRLRGELEDLSAATGALAPEGGVDCEGDGSTEVAAGAPLVCSVSGEEGQGINLAGPLTRLLASIADEAVVDLVASRTPTVEVTVAGRHLSVDLRRPQRLGWDVTFTCRSELSSVTSRISLAAVARAQTLGAALAEVSCGGRGALSNGGVLHPGARPEDPRTAPVGAGAQPAPPSHVQPQVQPGLLGAAAYAPQRELEVARSQAGDDEEERRFTRASGRPLIPAGTTARLGGAIVLTLLTGLALARRERLGLCLARPAPRTLNR
jgi:hypothetical protein